MILNPLGHTGLKVSALGFGAMQITGPGVWGPPRDHDEDMALIRELGANAVRLAHYQHSQYFYDLCDRYGLVVWAEIPVVNSAGAGLFVDNAKQQLSELIRQSGNHPSIVTWSVANELQHDKSDAGAIVPLGPVSVMTISPPWARTRSRAMARPRPAPPARPPVVKGLKSCSVT